MAGEGWDGAAGWLTLLHQENLTQLWRNVLTEGRESEIAGEALAKLFWRFGGLSPSRFWTALWPFRLKSAA